MDRTEAQEEHITGSVTYRRGNFAEKPRQSSAAEGSASGWVTTDVAAVALGVSPRTVREYIQVGRLEAKSEGTGVNKRWLVSIDAVQGLREERQTFAARSRERREDAAAVLGTEESAAETAEVFREMIVRLEARTAEAADARARLELTERAESTLREDLERERRRADVLELEADQLRARLEEARLSWWRRFFGFR